MEPAQVAQTPPAPVTNDDKIAALATGFLGELESNDDPEALDPDANAPEEAQPEEAQPEEEPKAEEAETPPQEPEDPVIEFELEDGKKVNVPEAVKPHLMRDKDYRQKTMALAETRKTLEQLTQQAQQVATQAQQMAPYHAQLFAMENRAQQLSQVLTNELMASDPVEFNRAQGELAILLRNRDQLAAGLHQQQSYLSAQQAELLNRKLAVDAPKLFEQFPDLAKPETKAELTKYLQGEGLSDEEMFHINFSVNHAKLAWKAKQYDRMVKENAKSAEKLKQQVKTLPPATQSSRAVDNTAQVKKLQSEWRKGGGKLHDPNFAAALSARLRGK